MDSNSTTNATSSATAHHSSHTSNLLRSSPLLFGFVLITVLFVVVRCGFGWNRVFRESMGLQNRQGLPVFVDLTGFMNSPYNNARKPELWDVHAKDEGAGSLHYWRDIQPLAADVLQQHPPSPTDASETPPPQSPGNASAMARTSTRQHPQSPHSPAPIRSPLPPSHEGDVLQVAFLIQMPTPPQDIYERKLSEKAGMESEDMDEFYDIGVTSVTVARPPPYPTF